MRKTAVGLGIVPYNDQLGTGELRYVQLTAAGDQAAAFPHAELDAQACVQVILHQFSDGKPVMLLQLLPDAHVRSTWHLRHAVVWQGNFLLLPLGT